MPWPLSQDYNEALQNPQTSFNDPELRQGQVVVNALGMPQPCSGNFADVYAVDCPATKSKWAVKCFTREVHGLRERYSEISLHLQLTRLPFIVDFQYLEQGIRIAGRWYPILKMNWVEGLTLNAFVRDMLDKPAMLDALGQIWLRMARRLRDTKIGHCDLQHGNVLLVPGSTASSLAVKLIDYDGMWVPALAKTPSGEVGHSAYQHPQRLRDGIYAPEVDRFSLLVVYCALRALRIGGRQLWERYDTGDNLLFRQSDFESPARSPLIGELLRMKHPEVHPLVAKLIEAARAPLAKAPHLADLIVEEKPSTSAHRSKVQAAPQTAAAAATEPNAFQDLDVESTGIRSRRKTARSGSLIPWLAVGSIAACAVVGGVLLWGGHRGGNTEKPAPQKESMQDKSGPAANAPKENDSPHLFPKSNGAFAKPAASRVPIPDGPSGEVRRFKGYTGEVYGVAFSPDGKRALSGGGGDNSLRLWDVAGGEMIRKLDGHTQMVWSVAFSPDGKRAVSAAYDNTVRVWDLDKGELIQVFSRHGNPVRRAVFTPDGKRVLSAGWDRMVRLWDVENAQQIRSFAGNQSNIYWMAVSPDGKRVVSTGGDHAIHCWDVANAQELEPYKGNTGDVYAIAFSSDGQFLAAGGANRVVRIWRNSEPSVPPHNLKGHTGPVNAVAFTPDGRRLLSASHDRTVRMWDVATGTELGRFYGPEGCQMLSLAVSPDGRFFLSGGSDRMVRLWRVGPANALAANPPRAIGRMPPSKAAETVVPNKPSAPDQPEPTPSASKLTVPDDAARKKATEEIRDTYKTDYAEIQKADDRIALAVKLLKRGTSKSEEAVLRFAYLCEARDQAARGGDAVLSLSAIDELTQTFAVSPLPLKTAALELAAKAPQKPESAKKLLEQTLEITDEAENADDYEQAAKLLKIGQTVANRSGDAYVRGAVTQRENRVRLLRADYAKIADAVKTLAGKADDAAASLTVGKFRCFVKEDWSKGLPLLARSQDAELAELARKEMEKPMQGDEQAGLGQAWETFAEKQSNASIKKAARRRAKHWFYAALPSLKGGKADRIAAQLEVKSGKLRFRPGLIAVLFKHQAFEKRVKARLDYQVDFDWGFDRPAPKVPADDFSIRWQGVLIPPRAGKFTLFLEHDDGARLKIDGATAIDHWGEPGNDSKEIVLSNQPHLLQLEMHDIGAQASMRLHWSMIGGFRKEPVPADVLFHEIKQERLLAP